MARMQPTAPKGGDPDKRAVEGPAPAETGAAPVPRVLIVAPNASSRFGGEAFLPLRYFEILRRRGHAPRLITHARNRADLAAYLGSLEGIDLLPETRLHRILVRLGRRLPAPLRRGLAGTLLQILDGALLAPRIRRLVRAGAVDLIHQPAPVSPLAPSGLHRFGLPLVIGPMNGAMDYPPGYDDLESPAARRLVAGLRRGARLLNRLVPGKRRAAVLLAANPRTRAALPFPDHPDIRILPENGVDLATWTPPADIGPGRPGTLRLTYMGRLVDWKMVDITLEAVARARQDGVAVSLDILGDGPERKRLMRLAARLGLGEAVVFHGFRSQPDCAALLREGAADRALILNSVHECGGAVVLEAMALGLPVIAADWGGPADYLDPACGILVAPVPRATFAARLAAAIGTLAADPETRRWMGATGRRKVTTDYDWERKVDQICTIYAEAAGAAAPAPRRGAAR